ncbi:MAG TPA: hypothetical protein VHV83_15700, partial [Armatimonadota bacterium]|nr:hypothetical protein [Armatimonadota bacterium]
SVQSLRSGGVAAILRMPKNETFTGTLDAQIGDVTRSLDVQLHPAEKKYIVRLPGKGTQAMPVMQIGDDIIIPLPGEAKLPENAIRVQLHERTALVADSGTFRLVPLNVSTANAIQVNDGDATIPAKFSLTDVTYHDPTIPATNGLRFTYDYAQGWKFVRIAPSQPYAVTGKPKAIGVWVRGNQSGALLNMRFLDSTGRCYQAGYGLLNFDGWRFMSVRIDGTAGMYQWGGTGEPGKIAYPISLDTFVLIDGMRSAMHGDVEFANFQLIYME